MKAGWCRQCGLWIVDLDLYSVCWNCSKEAEKIAVLYDEAIAAESRGDHSAAKELVEKYDRLLRELDRKDQARREFHYSYVGVI